MNSRNLILILLSIMLVLAVGCKKVEKVEEATKDGVEEKQSVEAFGIVKAKEIRNITIDFHASLESIPVENGQWVSQGDTLAVLNIQDFEGLLQIKEYELNIQRIERNIIQGRIFVNQLEDPRVKLALNELAFTEDQQRKAQEDLVLQQVLFKEGAIAQKELETYEVALITANKAVEDARAALQLNTQAKKEELSELQIQGEKIKLLEKELAVMKAKQGKSYLLENKVIADVVNGVVLDIGYRPGDEISPEKKLLSIMNMDSLVIEAEIPEEFIQDVILGAEVNIVPLADKGKEFKGKVVRISNQAIQKNGETIIPIEIAMDQGTDFLKPNYNVDISIIVK